MNELSNGITIELENGTKYHTLDDWGLALGNNNYIGDPEQETWYVNVPYRNGSIDLSESISGKRIFKQRPLAFTLGGLTNRNGWDSLISDIRNKIHGRKCKIIIDNDNEYFWLGRAYIVDFDRFRELGTFTLSVPQADPYKYNVLDSTEPWIWDSFNFRTGIIQSLNEVILDNEEKSIRIPEGYMPVSPQIICRDVRNLTVTQNGKSYKLIEGENRFPSLIVNEEETTLTFNGTGKALVVYRGGSL